MFVKLLILMNLLFLHQKYFKRKDIESIRKFAADHFNEVRNMFFPFFRDSIFLTINCLYSYAIISLERFVISDQSSTFFFFFES